MFIKIKWSHKNVSYGYISLWSLVHMETGENTQCNLSLLTGEVADGQGHPRVLLPFLKCLFKRAWEVLRLDLQVLGLELRNENQHLVSILGLSLYRATFPWSKPVRCEYVYKHSDTLVHGPFSILNGYLGPSAEAVNQIKIRLLRDYGLKSTPGSHVGWHWPNTPVSIRQYPFWRNCLPQTIRQNILHVDSVLRFCLLKTSLYHFWYACCYLLSGPSNKLSPLNSNFYYHKWVYLSAFIRETSLCNALWLRQRSMTGQHTGNERLWMRAVFHHVLFFQGLGVITGQKDLKTQRPWTSAVKLCLPAMAVPVHTGNQ